MWENCAEYFGIENPVDRRDGIDLFNSSTEQVREFLTLRPWLCDFCDVRGFKSTGKWKQSNRNMREWILKEKGWRNRVSDILQLNNMTCDNLLKR